MVDLIKYYQVYGSETDPCSEFTKMQLYTNACFSIRAYFKRKLSISYSLLEFNNICILFDNILTSRKYISEVQVSYFYA